MTTASLSEQQHSTERRSIDQSKIAYQKPQPNLEHAVRHYTAIGLGKDHVRRIVR